MFNIFKNKVVSPHEVWTQLPKEQRTDDFNHDYLGETNVDTYLYYHVYDRATKVFNECPKKFQRFLDQDAVLQYYYEVLRPKLIQKGKFLFKSPEFDTIS